jgi:hypothetical protein
MSLQNENVRFEQSRNVRVHGGAEGRMETERIALSQRERDWLRVLHEVKQKQINADRSRQAAEGQRSSDPSAPRLVGWRSAALLIALDFQKKKKGVPGTAMRYRQEFWWSLVITTKSARHPWSTQIPCLFVPQLYPLVHAESLCCVTSRTPPRVSTRQECLFISSELHAIVCAFRLSSRLS